MDKTIMEADKDRDGKISFEEFTAMVENTDVSMSMTLGTSSTMLIQDPTKAMYRDPGLTGGPDSQTNSND